MPVVFDPEPQNPHPNAYSIDIDGRFLPWDGLEMSDFYLEMAGVGTLELSGPSYLVNSTLTLDTPASLLYLSASL
jgi:hypothetical protein